MIGALFFYIALIFLLGFMIGGFLKDEKQK
ncbi:hypothetical protein JOC86_002351 [Bacillus pakistanensis]|uniref:Uncharacterized protein n=1 Tax=Rossellomorea pakistanensis TaxID=992288 RepID=A0ABS2ND75_9BACI|nr:hypothetical protein [Bacillus pakistanensis]